MSSSNSNNDITLDCRARRTRIVRGERLLEFEGQMISTLCQWIPTDPSPSMSWDSHSSYDTCTVGPELVLTPIDAVMPSPCNNRRCKSSSPLSKLHGTPQSYRISAYDISSISCGASQTTTAAATLQQRSMSSPHKQQQYPFTIQLTLASTATIWELQCHTRNAYDLLWTALKAQVHEVVPMSSTSSLFRAQTREPNTDESIDSLTERCIQQSLDRESLADKWERRWGKVTSDITHMVTGANV